MTGHLTWWSVLEGLPGHKLELPVSQQHSIETAVQQAVESAHKVIGLLEVNEIDIRKLIVAHEENIEEMVKELDEEEVQQPVAEEAGNADEFNTADLHTILKLFEKFIVMLYNIHPQQFWGVCNICCHVQRNAEL